MRFVYNRRPLRILRTGHKVISPAEHEELRNADVSNRQDFLKHLDLHSQGKTSYLEMSRGLAATGIEKWTFDTNKMTMTHYHKRGNIMLLEEIE